MSRYQFIDPEILKTGMSGRHAKLMLSNEMLAQIRPVPELGRAEMAEMSVRVGILKISFILQAVFGLQSIHDYIQD